MNLIMNTLNFFRTDFKKFALKKSKSSLFPSVQYQDHKTEMKKKNLHFCLFRIDILLICPDTCQRVMYKDLNINTLKI